MIKKIKFKDGRREIYFGKKKVFTYINKKYFFNYIKSKEKIDINHVNDCIAKNLINIKQKLKDGQKINFGFFIIRDSMFPAFPLIDKILEYEIFNPIIVIIPYNDLPKKEQMEAFDSTHNYVVKKYPDIEIIKAYDENNGKCVDVSDRLDITCLTTPYRNVLNPLHRAEYLFDKKVLPIHIFYGFTSNFNYDLYNIFSQSELRFCWKIFLDAKYAEDKITLMYRDLDNKLVTSGCVKLDAIKCFSKKNNFKKTIILAPHHSIGDSVPDLKLSTFLKFSDFFLELPKLYPDINFIFRPHPFLKIRMQSDDYWGVEKTEKYFNTLESYPNVVPKYTNEYFKEFVESDGIITDCGSFLAEYLCVDNPGCYLLKNEKATNLTFSDLGKECLQHYYIAYNQNDILDYINNIVIGGMDYKKEKRHNFVKNHISFNDFNTSKYILDYIVNQIKI
ncbi:CDP-glycerol glycerophosphotransferase family protein [Campylobacter sp. Cr9]|uniref:CDP-glycerol glycerophosphotransferase family protein n=1 Tax=Campylobacter sp. Cr9 TaxID=2735728 RepID=UPI0030155811|nr:CDP-glycerol glycerophosphotransferase family protein [Campylobacter sp. Cr9]